MNETQGLPCDLNDLARQAARGNEQAIAELFKRPDFLRMVDIQCRSVWRTHRRHNGVRDLEDLIQATCVRILRGISKFRGESNCTDDSRSGNPLAAWIHTIARNAHLKDVKRERREEELLGQIVSDISRAQFQPTAEMSVALMEAYEKLDPYEQNLLDMRLEGFKPQEMAEIICRTEWLSWDQERKENEAKKMSKRVNMIYEKFLETLGIQSPIPKPKRIEPPNLKSKKARETQCLGRTKLMSLRSFKKASGR